MKENRILTCIVCPRGCTLEVSFDSDGKVASVVGNACKRGVTYATDECTHPRRTVTSTVRATDGSVVAVKTLSTVPKEKIFEVMKEINSVTASLPVRVGDVIIADVAGTGVSVVATANKE
jgi:CxxC motif-containing protein